MAFLHKLFGISTDIVEDRRERRELQEAKRELDETRGYFRQAILRVDAGSRQLMRTWEAANGMLEGENDQDQR
jgi:hypothetical protein